MEALSFLEFGRSITGHDTTQKENKNITTIEACSENDLDEGDDDSLFELDLTAADFDNSKREYKQIQQQTLNSLSSINSFSKRKILPIEPNSKSKPQSPISSLKSAPKLRKSKFKKRNSKTTVKMEKPRETQLLGELGKLFTILFKVEEPPKPAKLTRSLSFRKSRQKDCICDSASSSSLTGFYINVIKKYWKRINPLCFKVSKKNDEMEFSGVQSDVGSSSSSYSQAALTVKKEKKGSGPIGLQHLDKTKSASAAVLSPARRDDGIQSAILHCKKSLNPKDSSSLSRSTSCSSQETYTASSSRFSNYSSLEFASAKEEAI